jgi:hypothetical protein
MYIGLHVKYVLFCQVLMKLEYYGLSFKKYSNFKLHENPSVGAELCGRTDTDMTKVRVAFRYFAKAPKDERIRRTRLPS